MGRYTSVSGQGDLPLNNSYNTTGYQTPYTNTGIPSQVPPQVPGNWPTVFNKPVIGLDLNGLIVEDVVIKGPESIKVLPRALEGIRTLRLKGYKVFILSDQPSISKGLNTSDDIQRAFDGLMQQFGQAGIFSIDGFLFNTTEMKMDEYAKPNLGMVKRAENEMLKGAKFKDGWYVGDSLLDLKYADKMGAKPVLIRSGNYQHAVEQLEKFTYRDLKRKTKIYQSLVDFANSLE